MRDAFLFGEWFLSSLNHASLDWLIGDFLAYAVPLPGDRVRPGSDARIRAAAFGILLMA